MGGAWMSSTDAVGTSNLASDDVRLYQELVTQYRAKVYDYLCWLCGDESAAADLAAETYLKLWMSIDSLRDRRKARPFLFRIALNEYRQHARRLGREPVSIDDVDESALEALPEPVEALERAAVTRGVRLAVAQLPEIHRSVVVLHNLEGLTLREVGEVLGVPTGTAKSRLSSAFTMLRRSLRDMEEEEDGLR